MERTQVKMSANALRQIMGESFDYEAYENGRRDTRNFTKKHTPEEINDKLEEVKDRISCGVYRYNPSPSYWIGCLCEFGF